MNKLISNDRQNFLEKARNLPLQVSEEQLEKCDLYVENLLKWQKKINLIGPATVKEPYTRHVLDAAQIVQHVPRGTILDVGSGAGIPGLVWSIFMSNPIYLCERIVKKASFLSDTTRKLSLGKNHHIIADDVANVIEQFDIITGRAVTNISEFLHLTQHCAHKDTLYILPKGKDFEKELNGALDEWRFDVDIKKSIVQDTSKICFLNNIQGR